MWNIDKTVKKGDYIYAVIPDHPNASKYGYVLMHRAVMENKLNRLLHKEEIVHHINHDKKDNRPENLELMCFKTHASLHGKKKGRACVDLICPQCNTKFTKWRNHTHLQIKRKLNATFCSSVCRGKFSAAVQYNGITEAQQIAITNNVVREYKKYSD